jgi:hypothetical protein
LDCLRFKTDDLEHGVQFLRPSAHGVESAGWEAAGCVVGWLLLVFTTPARVVA